MEGSLSACWMACLGFRNGTILLQKLFNPEWQITPKCFLLSSFLIGFSFSPTAEISSLEFEFEENLLRKTTSIFKEGIGQESNGAANQEKHFLTLPDLTFGFVHKRSGNEISAVCICMIAISPDVSLHQLKVPLREAKPQRRMC